MPTDYVHGYSARESIRLTDQATTLTELLHADTLYPPGSLVLEAGCGVGAQTVILAGNSPRATFTSIDISAESLAKARRQMRAAGLANVTFEQADIFSLPFGSACFDHVFVCFVLEHPPDPAGALEALMAVLKPGGSITVIEGDHGSAYFHPDSGHARRAIQCLVHLQEQAGGASDRMAVRKPGGSITVIEGDHGSAYFHPDSGHARRAIQCLVHLQEQAGGDAQIGSRLYPLLGGH